MTCNPQACSRPPTCSQRVVYRDALSNNDPVPDGFVVDEDATDLDEPASDDPSLSDRRGTCLAGVLRWPASRGVGGLVRGHAHVRGSMELARSAQLTIEA